MPWRKYPETRGKYGPLYKVAKGIKVRRDHRRLWIVDINVNGKRKNRTIGPGRENLVKAIKVAEETARRIQTAKQNPKVTVESSLKPRLIDYAWQWHEDNENRWTPDTHQRYEQIIRLHLESEAAYHQPVDRVKRREVKKHMRRLSKKRSPATVEAVHSVISGIFEEAIDDGLVQANPANKLLKKILPPKNQRDLKQPAPLTVKEVDRMLIAAEKSCSRSMRLLLMVMVFMGLRLGEVLAMRVRHLNLDRMLYHVVEGFKLKVFKKPKGGKLRFVDVPDFLVSELEAHIAYLKKEGLKQGKGGRVDLLFVDPTEKGGPWPFSQRKVQSELKRVCKAARLEVRNPHDLRHTYAKILLTDGMSPAYVQRQLGHSSISITVDVYGHLVPGEGRAGLEDVLTGGGKVIPNPVRKMRIFA